MYQILGISEELEKLAKEVEEEIKPVFTKLDEICEYNSAKVLKAFQEAGVSESTLTGTNGYGLWDPSRDKVEAVFANVFGAEDALVRNQFMSGTHALTVALFAALRPGDTLLSISGRPYDTLCEVIGIEENPSSLKAFGVKYEQIDLLDNDFDYEKIAQRLKEGNVKLIEIQRSCGYSTRKTLTLDKIEKVIKQIRKINPKQLVMVDDCYGEFTGIKEPTNFGADLMVGSMMKNIGGGIAETGAYIAGTKEMIELAGERLVAPGTGREEGPSFDYNKQVLKGLFFAPRVTNSCVKTAVFASRMLERLGYQVSPKYDEERSDIVQKIELGQADKLIKYCQGIQMGSPIDSDVIPEPADMAGYADKVIMAAGTFTSGATGELSCDGPLRAPYTAYMQGGLTYEYGKLGVLKAIQNMQK